MSNLSKLESEIISAKGNPVKIESLIYDLFAIRKKLDWQVTKFLDTYCATTEQILEFENNQDSPKTKMYKHLTDEYTKIDRLIRIAKAYK